MFWEDASWFFGRFDEKSLFVWMFIIGCFYLWFCFEITELLLDSNVAGLRLRFLTCFGPRFKQSFDLRSDMDSSSSTISSWLHSAGKPDSRLWFHFHSSSCNLRIFSISFLLFSFASSLFYLFTSFWTNFCSLSFSVTSFTIDSRCASISLFFSSRTFSCVFYKSLISVSFSSTYTYRIPTFPL